MWLHSVHLLAFLLRTKLEMFFCMLNKHVLILLFHNQSTMAGEKDFYYGTLCQERLLDFGFSIKVGVCQDTEVALPYLFQLDVCVFK